MRTVRTRTPLLHLLMALAGLTLFPFVSHADEAMPVGALAKWYASTGTVSALTVLPDGRIMSLGSDSVVQVWDRAGVKELRRIKFGPFFAITSAALSPDGRWAAIAHDRTFRFFDLDKGKETFRIPDVGTPTCMEFSVDGTQLVTGLADGWLAWWDPSTGKMIRRMRTDLRRIDSLAFSPNGRLLVAGNYFCITVWLTGGTMVRQIPTYCGAQALAFAPDGRSLASTGSDCTTRVWETETGLERHRFANPSMANNQLSFTAHGELAVGGPGKRVQVYEPMAGIALADWTGHGTPVRHLAGTPDGNLVTSDASGVIVLWQVSTVRPLVAVNEAGEAELTKAWNDLLRADAAAVKKAMGLLLRSPKGCVRIARSALKPVPLRSKFDVAAAIQNLGSPRFAERERAMEQLRDVLPEVTEPLTAARAGPLSPEALRRIDLLLQSLRSEPTPAAMQALRGLELLERIGTPEAKTFLTELAQGDPAARLTREAQWSLKRLAK